MSRNGCLQIIITILILLALSWWFFLRDTPDLPEVRESDAGDYSYVRQVVPLLQGRKIKGYEEIRVLADLINASDRETLVEVLTRGDTTYAEEYIKNWSDIVVDWMRAHRETGKSQATCFGTPSIATNSDGLANYILSHDPDASPDGYSIGGTPVNFNMADVLLSSFKKDSIAPAYLACLFPMVNKPITGAEIIEQNKRADLGATLTHVYTHRQMLCTTCHNSTESTTGPQTFWNRHYPIYGNFEKALFGRDTGRDTREVEAMLRVQGMSGSVKPWGMENCGSFVAHASVPNDTLTNPDTGMPLEAYFVESHGRRGSVWDLEEKLRGGISKLASQGLVRGPDAATQEACDFCASSCEGDSPAVDPAAQAREDEVTDIVNGSVGHCTDCHGSWSGDSWVSSWVSGGLVIPGDAANSIVIRRLTGDITPRMPMGGPYLTNTQIDVVRAWINGLTDSGSGSCGMCSSLICDDNIVDGEAGFAYTVASNVVSNTWSEIFGPRLTIANYFPRNAGQGKALWNLTENVFIPSNWSMSTLLNKMFNSGYFNRKPPLTSAGSFAYEMPLFFEPWAEGDPRFPPQSLAGWVPGSSTPPDPDPAYTADTNDELAFHKNAMTDAVHRYTPRSLLYSVHAALGWPAPPRFSGGENYPSDTLRKTIGQFWRDAEPGFREVDFQGLLKWESIHGRCEKPSTVGGDDWIERLIDAIDEFNNANPGANITKTDLILTMKDWLLGFAHIQTVAADNPQGMTQSERQILQGLFGPLNQPAQVNNPAQRDQLESKLRDYCGVLLETPQFMLAGIAPTELGEKPRLRVCNPGEPCSYQEICQSLQPAFAGRLESLICHEDSLEVRVPAPPPGLGDFCRRGFCGFYEGPFDIDCIRNPATCPRLPQCDPRCALVDCCGGPLPSLDKPGYMLGYAEGGLIDEVKGIKIRYSGEQEFVDLNEAYVLKAGDLLAMPPGSQVKIKMGKEVYETPDKGIPGKGKQGTWYFMVTGPTVVQPEFKLGTLRRTPGTSLLERTLLAPWTRNGEAGAPILDGQKGEPDPNRPGQVPVPQVSQSKSK